MLCSLFKWKLGICTFNHQDRQTWPGSWAFMVSSSTPYGSERWGCFLVSQVSCQPNSSTTLSNTGKIVCPSEKPLRASSHYGPGSTTTHMTAQHPKGGQQDIRKPQCIPVSMQSNPCTWAQAIIIPAISNQGALRKVMFTLCYNWSLALQELSTARESTWVGPFQTLAVASKEERNGHMAWNSSQGGWSYHLERKMPFFTLLAPR